jgi:hypothetical protein
MVIIAISGASGSGKSTSARSLASALDGQIGSFGDYVRCLALDRQEKSDRRSLQNIGEEVVRRNPAGFVAGFLKWLAPTKKRDLILDGVRHLSVDQALRAWAETEGLDYFRVHILLPDATRAARKVGVEATMLTEFDSHPVEREVLTTLRETADLVLDGAETQAAIVAAVLAMVPVHSIDARGT